MVTAETLAALTGRTVDDDRAEAVIATVTSRAKSYTRGNGFDGDVPAEDLQTVIATASLRLLMDPTGLQGETMGPFSPTVVSFSAGQSERRWSSTATVTAHSER